MAKETGTRSAVYAALAGNLLVGLTKIVAAMWTGSASMQSEAVHSFVDTGNELLLLYGMHRSAQRPDPSHPLGYGRELYFWSFIVALLVFALGAGVSVYQGVMHMLHPEPITDPLVNYIVLALAFVFEGGSWLISLRQFRSTQGSLGFYAAFRRSKDPPSFMVLFEDSAALVGIVIAALGTFVSTHWNVPEFDGVASVLIGLVLATIATLLARESKSLLIGEAANAGLRDSIVRVASSDGCTVKANGVLTVQLAPDQILAALSVEFADELRAPQIEELVVDIERRVQAMHPEVVSLFVKPQTNRTFDAAIRLRFGDRVDSDPDED
jgi:cation diffusion facilitator family transporter